MPSPTCGMGINGVWAAIVLSQIAKALLKSWWFRTRILRRLEVRSPSTCTTSTRPTDPLYKKICLSSGEFWKHTSTQNSRPATRPADTV